MQGFWVWRLFCRIGTLMLTCTQRAILYSWFDSTQDVIGYGCMFVSWGFGTPVLQVEMR